MKSVKKQKNKGGEKKEQIEENFAVNI